ncbi:MAG: hypothetical protein KKD31_01530 [Bacteroidetes bacterium]|nr:hypothetical protein [Bacteroidota bacterium]
MKSKNKKISKAFEREYQEIMTGFQQQESFLTPKHQWNNPNDFIVKFSLYQETPNSITSTDTFVNLSL